MTLPQIAIALKSLRGEVTVAEISEPAPAAATTGNLHFATEADYLKWLRAQPNGSLRR